MRERRSVDNMIYSEIELQFQQKWQLLQSCQKRLKIRKKKVKRMVLEKYYLDNNPG